MEKWQPLFRSKKKDIKSNWPVEAVEDAVGKEMEVWTNDLYTVIVRRGMGEDENLRHTWLSIKRNDQQPVHDWRHFQWIKNQLVGKENEAIEIYPKESRMVDQANQYHLFVLENPAFTFPFGFVTRIVSEQPTEGARQRAFPKNMKPHDLQEQHQRQREMLRQVMGSEQPPKDPGAPYNLINQEPENE